MKEIKKNNSEESNEYPKTYKGKYWDIVVLRPEGDDPERIKRETDPEYQEKKFKEIFNDLMKRYVDALERLKDL